MTLMTFELTFSDLCQLALVIIALSLPAACAPETAGEAVARTVCDMIGQREEAS